MTDNISKYNILIQKDDSRAFRQVFETLYPGLGLYAVSFVIQPQVAEELVQESFMRLWQNRARLDEQFQTKAFLYKTVHNLALNYLRHQKIVNRFLKEANINTTSYEWKGEPNPFLSVALFNAIELLPERAKLIFEMSRIDGLKHREIAQKLSISEKTVEVQVRKARLFLQKKLKNYYSDR